MIGKARNGPSASHGTLGRGLNLPLRLPITVRDGRTPDTADQ
jgi:hypothetical protein